MNPLLTVPLRTIARLIVPTLLLLFIAMVGCQSSGPIKPRDKVSTKFVATTVANRGTNATRTVARVLSDGSTNRKAEVVFDAETLPYTRFLVDTDSAYTAQFSGYRHNLPGVRTLSLDDKSGNSVSLSLPVVDSFTLSGVSPQSRIANGNQPVIISWTGSANASTYVLAAVRRGFAFTGAGYSQFATSSSTSETLNQIAFFQTDGVNPDTGWYDLYVYAIAGIPDSASTARVLPVPLPVQQSDNLALTNLTGHYGSIAVTRRDSVRIPVQP